ncbi:MAG: hypothetical protein CVU71_10315 [Deltaproteobacteria bacterium HGW-Deltaproteobacteria-6]|jgi:hypothetical protein|nr:MAG: hypothetical protein CVU71_10315 [Deltaproteobacteria bacterium HGW-Deltaproteobacteria-6]
MMRQIPNLGVLNIADSFYEAAQALNKFSDSRMSVPTIVNATFALEIFLKSLNIKFSCEEPTEIMPGLTAFGRVREVPLETGHMPSKLFCALDANIKNGLENCFAQEQYRNKPKTLIEALQAYDGDFQNWRYIFEGKAKSFDIQLLLELLRFLSATIHGLSSKWA